MSQHGADLVIVDGVRSSFTLYARHFDKPNGGRGESMQKNILSRILGRSRPAKSRSSIVFLASCSNNKKNSQAGSNRYDPSQSVAALLPRCSAELHEKRKFVLKVVKRTYRAGNSLKRLPYNRFLEQGPDFGGFATPRYLPAILRYSGRFYVELGNDRLELVSRSEHHFLILSGLYGLLTFADPIQAYSCHVPDSP